MVSSPRPVDLSVAAIPFKALESCLAAATALTGEKAAALHSPRLTSELGVLMLLLTTTLSAVPPVLSPRQAVFLTVILRPPGVTLSHIFSAGWVVVVVAVAGGVPWNW